LSLHSVDPVRVVRHAAAASERGLHLVDGAAERHQLRHARAHERERVAVQEDLGVSGGELEPSRTVGGSVGSEDPGGRLLLEPLPRVPFGDARPVGELLGRRRSGRRERKRTARASAPGGWCRRRNTPAPTGTADPRTRPAPLRAQTSFASLAQAGGTILGRHLDRTSSPARDPRRSGPRLRRGLKPAGVRCRYVAHAVDRGGARRARPAPVRAEGRDPMGRGTVRRRIRTTRPRGAVAQCHPVEHHTRPCPHGRRGCPTAGCHVGARGCIGGGPRGRPGPRGDASQHPEVQPTSLSSSASGAGARGGSPRSPWSQPTSA
jgi:hypothetical protein